MSKTKKKIMIIGAAQHARIISNIIRTSKLYRKKYSIGGYIDDNAKLHGTKIDDITILGSFKNIQKIGKKINSKSFIMGISHKFMDVRDKYYNTLIKSGFTPVNAIHDTAIIDKKSIIGVGTVINPGCIVNAFAKIGNNCVIYSGSIIEHEDIIDDNVFIGPGVVFTADVKVGKNTLIGAGTKIIPHVKIGKNVKIGVGSVIIKDVKDNEVVAGIPAKKINS